MHDLKNVLAFIVALLSYEDAGRSRRSAEKTKERELMGEAGRALACEQLEHSIGVADLSRESGARRPEPRKC